MRLSGGYVKQSAGNGGIWYVQWREVKLMCWGCDPRFERHLPRLEAEFAARKQEGFNPAGTGHVWGEWKYGFPGPWLYEGWTCQACGLKVEKVYKSFDTTGWFAKAMSVDPKWAKKEMPWRMYRGGAEPSVCPQATGVVAEAWDAYFAASPA